jgi:hypothetical protein
MEVSVEALAEAYRRLGFIPCDESEGMLSFKRLCDDLIMFHSVISPGRGLDLSFILEDARRWDADLSDQLRDALA